MKGRAAALLAALALTLCACRGGGEAASPAGPAPSLPAESSSPPPEAPPASSGPEESAAPSSSAPSPLPPVTGEEEASAGETAAGYVTLTPFEWDDVGRHPVAVTAAGEGFLIANIEARGETPAFAVECYGADGRLIRTTPLPDQGAALRFQRADGGRVALLCAQGVAVLDETGALVQTLPLPGAVRDSLGNGGGYDITPGLDAVLYDELGGRLTPDGWRDNGRPAGSTVLTLATGEARRVGGAGSARRFAGRKLLMQGSQGSVLADLDGSNPRSTGVDLLSSLSDADALGHYLPLYEAAVFGEEGQRRESGVFDLEAEEFIPLLEMGASAAVGGSTLYAIDGDGALQQIDLLTGRAVPGSGSAEGPSRRLRAATERGVLLIEEDGALRLRTGQVPAQEERPANLPLPKTLASGQTALAGGEPVNVEVRLVSGYYWDKDAPDFVPGGGVYDTNYIGTYHAVVTDGQGRVLWNEPIAVEDRTMNFSGEFPLVFDDYNGDGSPDFTLGQWGSSANGNRFVLFTVKPGGHVARLEGSECTNQSFDFSIALDKVAPGAYECAVYSQETGESVRYRYTWEDGAFYSGLAPS